MALMSWALMKTMSWRGSSGFPLASMSPSRRNPPSTTVWPSGMVTFVVIFRVEKMG
jgi:hypothetical protein